VSEPTSPEAVAAWTEAAQRERDPFERVRLASHEHRGHHGPGCSVYPTSSGPLLSVLAAAIKAERILELGCGLGYSALCLAHDSHGLVETIERELRMITDYPVLACPAGGRGFEARRSRNPQRKATFVRDASPETGWSLQAHAQACALLLAQSHSLTDLN
jgi:hypothetical protein